MKFFLDENFPRSAKSFLLSRGHEVADVHDESMQGSTDLAIFEVAQGKASVFLTTDRDFFHTVPHLFEKHHGVVVIALRQPNRKNILDRLKWFLDNIDEAQIMSKVYQLRDRTYLVI